MPQRTAAADLAPGLDRYWLKDARVPACLLAGDPPGPADRDGLVRADVRIEEGRVRCVEPAGTATPCAPGASLDGGIVWPCPADMHTHLDKGHVWPRAENPDGSFPAALEAVGRDREANWTAADVAARMEFGLKCSFAHGTRAVRTHLDSIGKQTAISWPVFAEMRDRWAGRIELQAVALTMPWMFLPGDPEGPEIARTVAAHRGVLGMVTFMHERLGEALDGCFALAEAHGLDLDFHVDETADPGAVSLSMIAETAIRRRFAGRVVAGHCCSLARQDEGTVDRTLDLVAQARIAVVTLPMCNMYLQDRAPGRTPRWRGVTLLHEMRARGIPVAAASDNCRDPFYGYGDHDMVEVFREAVRILHLDRPFADWPAIATATPAAVMGLDARIGPGAPADLVCFRARSWAELLSRPQSDRAVIRAGARSTATPPDYRELDAVVGAPGG
jgi:cytosine deaminase